MNSETEASREISDRRDRTVRAAAGLIALFLVPSVAVVWWGPWSGEGMMMRVLLPAGAALFVTVAVTGQGAESAKVLNAILPIMVVAGVLSAIMNPVRHLPWTYTAASVVAGIAFLAALRQLARGSRWPVAVVLAAMAALPFALGAMGGNRPTLGGYVEALGLTLEVAFLVIAAVGTGFLIWHRRRAPP